jgi:3',5'-cyclic AMP phosphodiesterase CpdA
MPKLFVVMPFGEKAIDGGVVDYDAIYARIFRPAGEAAGYEVSRIDEFPESGPIAEQYLRELYRADVVLADVSAPNSNVFYELGIRHAVSSAGTVLVAWHGARLPFDIAHLRVLFYGLDETAEEGARRDLTQAIAHAAAGPSPVRQILEKLGYTSSPARDPIAFEQELQGKIQRAQNLDQLIAVWKWAENLRPLPAPSLLLLGEKLAEHAAWDVSIDVLRAATTAKPHDFETHRQLGWHLRHAGYEEEAITEFRRALELNPNDPETLGMMGGVLKRRGEYVQAVKCYDFGAKLSPASQYMLVNQAALAILSNPKEPDAGIKLYRRLLENTTKVPDYNSDLWSLLVCGEAAFAIGSGEAGAFFERAVQLSPTQKPLRSAAEQLDLFASVGFRTDEASRFAALLRGSQIEILERVEPAPVITSSDADLFPVIIHISDPHFGTIERDGKLKQMHRFATGQYSRKLSEHLTREFKSTNSHFRFDTDKLLLVISGDLTYRAQTEEFERAREFLEEICNGIGIAHNRVVIVPGNHDIDWLASKQDVARRFDNFIGFLDSFYGPDLFRKLYPRLTWDLKFNSKRSSAFELVSILRNDPYVIVGMNSCVYETDQNHYGFIGGRQLEIVDELLASNCDRTLVRVAVFHHHLHPYPEPIEERAAGEPALDMSTLRDGGIVERNLERLGFDIVLHGHKHKPQIRETRIRNRNERGGVRRTSPLIVCGAGSIGVDRLELEHGQANQYAVLELQRSVRAEGVSFLRIESRELSLEPDAEWATTDDWNFNG